MAIACDMEQQLVSVVTESEGRHATTWFHGHSSRPSDPNQPHIEMPRADHRGAGARRPTSPTSAGTFWERAAPCGIGASARGAGTPR